MSALVYAGASQFMALKMLASGAGAIEIVLATFVLNFRHFVLGLSLMSRLRKVAGPWKVALSSVLTDETFAVASMRKEKTDPFFVAGLMLTSYLSWILGTVLGTLMSDAIPASISSSMSVALYAMFIGLLVPAVREAWKYGLIALLSMGLNTLFSFFVSGGWSIVLATVLGALAGIPLVRRKEK
jgi:4-azaleucine resistance transporter AzlC